MCASAHKVVGDTAMHARSSYTLLTNEAVLTYKGSNVFRREGRTYFPPQASPAGPSAEA